MLFADPMVQSFKVTVDFEVSSEEFYALTIVSSAFEESCHTSRGNKSVYLQ